jgi:hypothetical protein
MGLTATVGFDRRLVLRTSMPGETLDELKRWIYCRIIKLTQEHFATEKYALNGRATIPSKVFDSCRG